MARRLIAGVAFVAALVIAGYAVAHEGHVHKVMGTVITADDRNLEVKATDGKTGTIMLNEKTRILRGKTKSTAADIRPRERIVVTATETKGKDGKTIMIATEARLAEAAASK